MQLHNLLKFRSETKKRIGRGGKRGSYSGRGVKGQKSRAGRRIRPAERDLIIRLPKRRGFLNKPKSEKPVAINLADLNNRYKNQAGAAVVLDKKILGDSKILGKGEISFPVAIRGLKVSKSAKEKIIKAGGAVEK